ncbi:MAG: aspartate aminotransferase family protein [Rhodobacteraceae bacterium]|nr:aspartate aminotransferase family protein [Paracoccaceae bacterium]
MSHVFHRNSNFTPPIVQRGEGVYLYDTQGKQYLDGSGGAAVSCLGHGDAKVTDAIKSQLDQVAFAHTGFFTSAPAEALADKLIAHAPDGLDKVYLVSSGSEAIEAALKLSRQYFLEIDQPSRTKVIARRQSYHGNTLGALAAGGNLIRRKPFAPLMIETSHIAPCYEYRDRRADETSAEYGLRIANELETEIKRLGPENVMAFVAEPVVGATAGAVPPVAGYFKRIREICDKHGVLLILDEIMCGMGRTGTLFAIEQDGISPDITTIAKGLGAGYQPIGAMLCRSKIHDTIASGSGFFQHGHTYLGHPVAAAAGLAVLTRLIDDGLVAQSMAMGQQLQDALVSAFGQHPNIGDIRGRGLFRGLEFVADRDTKTPFSPDILISKRLKEATFDAGLICYPMSGTIDGVNGDHLLLAPPFILDSSHIDEIIGKLTTAFNEVF